MGHPNLARTTVTAELLRDRASYERHLAFDDEGRVIANYGPYQLASVFQSIVNRERQTCAYEALIRITRRDTHEPVPADLVFHQAPPNETELIHQTNLDRLSRVIHLRNYAPNHQNLPLHLNILPSSAVLAMNDITARRLAAIRINELGIPAENIIFEVTEDYQIDTESLSTYVARMRSAGFQFSVDDFGAGSSSLERVRLIAPSILKLDRELVLQHLRGTTTGVVDAVAAAKEFLAHTVAEGIENLAQFVAMRNAGVDFFQGYHFGRPKPFKATRRP